MGATGSKLEKALEDQFPEGERYFGLENFGNTCYCNSVLQNYSKDPHAKGGDSLTDVEKTKSNGSVLNRAKKRQLKGNVGATWRKLISQCAQLWCNS